MQLNYDRKAIDGLTNLRDGYVFLLYSVGLSAVLGFIPVVGHSILGILSIFAALKLLEGFKDLGDSKFMHASSYKSAYFWLRNWLIEIIAAFVILIIVILYAFISTTDIFQIYGLLSGAIVVLGAITIMLGIVAIASYMIAIVNLSLDSHQGWFNIGAGLTVIVFLLQLWFVVTVLHALFGGITVQGSGVLSEAFYSLYGAFQILLSLALDYLLLVVVELIVLYVYYKSAAKAILLFPAPKPQQTDSKIYQ